LEHDNQPHAEETTDEHSAAEPAEPQSKENVTAEYIEYAEAMSNREQIIPLCRAEFLQDFSIALGRRLKPIRHASKSVVAELDTCEHEGQSLERLTVWIETWYCTRASLALWEDGTVLVSVTLIPTTNNKKYEISFYPDCRGFIPEAFVEALRETVSVSTRLCYNESPLPLLRRIWRHRGQVETAGTLDSKQKA
jgi:hypothetical protein